MSITPAYQIKIFLKKKRKPWILITNKKDHFDEIYNQLTDKKDIIKLSNIIFTADKFNYAIMEEI